MNEYLIDRVQAPSACAGDYLSQVRRLENEISCRLAHIRCLREARPDGLVLSVVHAGQTSDHTGESAVRIEEMQQEVSALYDSMQKARSDIAKIVRRLPNTRARCLMEMRYLSGLSWESIAESLAITPRSALRLHQKALRSVDALLTDKHA